LVLIKLVLLMGMLLLGMLLFQLIIEKIPLFLAGLSFIPIFLSGCPSFLFGLSGVWFNSWEACVRVQGLVVPVVSVVWSPGFLYMKVY